MPKFLIAFGLFFATSGWASPRFNPQELHDLVKESIAKRVDEDEGLEFQLEDIHQRLIQDYPGLINERPRWIFNHTAAAMGQLQILYCSASEYLIFFGSNVGTGGHSGRHHMDIWDIMMIGKMRTSLEGDLDEHIYKPGDVGFLPRGKVKQFAIEPGSYMLEYGRGNVAMGLMNGVIAPALFINQDWQAMRQQLQDCAKIYVRQLFHGR